MGDDLCGSGGNSIRVGEGIAIMIGVLIDGFNANVVKLNSLSPLLV